MPYPQHLTPLMVVMAQASSAPEDTAVTPLVRPETSTGVDAVTKVPSPRAPSLLSPQHLTPPPVVRAHAKSAPAEMATTPLNPLTVTGVVLHGQPPQSCGPVVVPSPSSPQLLLPQHCTLPAVVSAHV